MSDWLEITTINALNNGEHILVDLEGTDVAVFKLEDQFYAIEDVCTHDGTEIACGKIEGFDIICPRHGARFCLKTGAAKSAPAYENIYCFPVRIVEEKVFIRDPRWD